MRLILSLAMLALADRADRNFFTTSPASCAKWWNSSWDAPF
jgi:hypothetical protein